MKETFARFILLFQRDEKMHSKYSFITINSVFSLIFRLAGTKIFLVQRPLKKQPTHFIFSFLLVVPLIATLLIGCNEATNIEAKQTTNNVTSEHESTPEKPTAASLKNELTALEADIEKKIGSANCSNSKQCGALAIGSKACGGPLTYIPYSTENTDTTLLLDLSEQHQQKNKALNELTGQVSDCMLVMQPTFICRDGKCQK